MIMRILALLFLAVSAMATPMQTNTISFAVPSPSPTKYSDFSMTWVGLSDQYIDMSFNGITISASDQIYLRLALQRKGSVALEVSGWAIANSNRVIGIVPYTNIPPSGPYYAEVLVKSGTGSPQMVVGFGQIKTESSIFGLSETQKWASTVFISPAYPTNLVLLAANDPTARIWAAGASNLAYAIAPLASNALSRNGGSVTGSLDFTSSGLDSLDYALFDAAPTGAISARRLQWNAARDTLRLGLNSTVNYDLGHQVILYARNADSNTINKGEVVYISGSSGDNATFMRASNDSETRSARTIGIMAETVAQNNFGNIVNQGTVYNLDTSAFPAGAGLYLGAGGTMQTNLPTAPLHGVFLGVVERSHANVGQIYVTIQNYQELRELSDVRLNGQTNLNVLTYIAASNRWEARSVSSMEADPVWGAVSNSIAMKIGLNSTNIVVSSNAARNASIALSNYFESAMSTASGAVYGAINTASNHLQSSITDVSNHFENASVNSSNAVYSTINTLSNYADAVSSRIGAASNALQSSILAVSNHFESASGVASNAVYASIVASSNHLQSSVIAVSNYFQSAMATASNKFNADIQAVSNLVVGASGIDTNATHQALAASNLAASAYTFATQAHVWAQSGSNLAFQTDANLTAASNSFVANITFASNSLSANLSLASNLAFRADMTAGIARGWAIAASNQVDIVATNNYFTSNSLSSNLSLASNLAFRADMTAGIARGWAIAASNQASVVATNNYFTSNSIMANLVLASNSLAANIVLSSNRFAQAITNRFTGHGTTGAVVGAENFTTSMYLRGDGIFTNSNLLLLSPPDTDNQNWRQFVSSSIIITNTDPNTDDEYRNGLGFTVQDHTGGQAFIAHDENVGLRLGFKYQSTNWITLLASTNDIGASSQPTNGSYINPAFQQRISIMRGYNNSNEKILNDILDTSWANPTSFTARSVYDSGITNVNAVRLGGALPSAYLTVASYQNNSTNHARFITTTVKPSSPTDSGLHGEMRVDATNIYIYIGAGGTNKWMRIPGSFTW